MLPALTDLLSVSSKTATGHFDMTEREKIHSGKLYQPMGDEILNEQLAYLDELAEINGRSRSGMLGWLLKMAQENDAQEDDD